MDNSNLKRDNDSVRKRPANPYESNRWRGLVNQENFLRLPERAELYAKLKISFSTKPVLQCYYSSLLELTYTVGDYSWAIKLRVSRDEGNPDALKVAEKYGIEGTNLDYIAREYWARMNNAFEEFNNWSKMLYFLPLSQEDIRRVKVFMSNKKMVDWLRKQVRKYLSELDTSAMPKNLAFLCRNKIFSDIEREAKKAAKEAFSGVCSIPPV